MQDRRELSEYTIVLANLSQVEQHARAAFLPWARGRSWETFFNESMKEREVGAWAKDHAMLTWVLVRRDEPEGEIYAGCETYRREALVRRNGSESVDSAWMYAIASVVTPVQHLRKGYATRLLQLLHYNLADPSTLPPFPAPWGAPPALPLTAPIQSTHQQRSLPSTSLPRAGTHPYLPYGIASILWSDVGSTFYSRCTIGDSLPGWVVDPIESSEMVWNLEPPVDGALDDWEVLYRPDITALAKSLSESARTALAINKGVDAWSIDPASPGGLEFVPLRDVSSAAESPLPLDAIPMGIRLQSSIGISDEVIALFALFNDTIGPRLLITSLINFQPHQLPSLFRALDVFGAEVGRKEGWAWGIPPDSPLVDAWKAEGRGVRVGKRAEKDGHLLGVAWYGREKGRLIDPQMWGWC